MYLDTKMKVTQKYNSLLLKFTLMIVMFKNAKDAPHITFKRDNVFISKTKDGRFT